jgi:hypothetical protein
MALKSLYKDVASLDQSDPAMLASLPIATEQRTFRDACLRPKSGREATSYEVIRPPCLHPHAAICLTRRCWRSDTWNRPTKLNAMVSAPIAGRARFAYAQFGGDQRLRMMLAHICWMSICNIALDCWLPALP